MLIVFRSLILTSNEVIATLGLARGAGITTKEMVTILIEKAVGRVGLVRPPTASCISSTVGDALRGRDCPGVGYGGAGTSSLYLTLIGLAGGLKISCMSCIQILSIYVEAFLALPKHADTPNHN